MWSIHALGLLMLVTLANSMFILGGKGCLLCMHAQHFLLQLNVTIMLSRTLAGHADIRHVAESSIDPAQR
jgi:hypothetical protein